MDASRRAALPVLVLGMLAVVQYWLAPRRPATAELRAPRQLLVTRSDDSGPGSLRQALITAGSSSTRVRILVEARRIDLQDPLPPLVNPHGIVVEAGAAGCTIDAGRLLTGAVFDLAAPDSALAGLTIQGAPSHAVLVRADRARLERLELLDNHEGIQVADAWAGLIIEGNTFRANGTGIRLGASGPGTIVRRNVFLQNENAGISALRGEPLVGVTSSLWVVDNHFEEDRISLVLGNVPVVVENNEIYAPFEAGIFLTGSGATIRGNRIQGAGRAGILAESPRGSRITGNDIGGGQIAVLVSAPLGAIIEGNRVYGNLAGIAMILADESAAGGVSANLVLGSLDAGIVLVGSSPRVDGNHSLGFHSAGVRLTDYRRGDGVLVRAEPHLESNVLAGDGQGVVRDSAQADPQHDGENERSEAEERP